MSIGRNIFFAMVFSARLVSVISEDCTQLQYESLVIYLLNKKLHKEEMNFQEWEKLTENYDPNFQEPRDGYSLLHVAVEEEMDGVVGWLLKARANPNLQMLWGNTPLHSAAEVGNVEIAKLLLDAGAAESLALLTGDKESPLMLARKLKKELWASEIEGYVRGGFILPNGSD